MRALGISCKSMSRLGWRRKKSASNSGKYSVIAVVLHSRRTWPLTPLAYSAMSCCMRWACCARAFPAGVRGATADTDADRGSHIVAVQGVRQHQRIADLGGHGG